MAGKGDRGPSLGWAKGKRSWRQGLASHTMGHQPGSLSLLWAANQGTRGREPPQVKALEEPPDHWLAAGSSQGGLVHSGRSLPGWCWERERRLQYWALTMAGSNSAAGWGEAFPSLHPESSAEACRDGPGRPQQPVPWLSSLHLLPRVQRTEQDWNPGSEPCPLPSVPPNLLGDQQHQEAQGRGSQGWGLPWRPITFHIKV